MSAIAGLILLDGCSIDPRVMENMLACLQHCGPDAQRALQAGNAAFGQTLLATTAEALSEAQPWTDATTGCIVVTDSRLDNRLQLAVSLGLGERDIDNVGDAELIFAAHQKWGVACAEHLLGDFTFAIWNPKTGQLFCARDQLGVRPFYYHYLAGKIFAFATTSEALRGLLQKPVALDEGRLTDALTDHLEGYDHTSTFFRDIKRLPAANTLDLQPLAAPTLRCYWQALQNPPSPFPTTEKQWLDQLEALFVESVHCRLRSHLPISSMLSGGLDSSSVVAIASEKLKQDGEPFLSAFSAVSDDAGCAETRAIRLMQSRFPVQAIEVSPCNPPDLLQAIAAQWPRLEEPFEAPYTIISAQYHLAKQNNKRIMLDGIDADALLTEADYLHDLARSGQWRKVWHECRASVRFWGPESRLSYFLRPLVSEFLIPKILRRLVQRLRKTFQTTDVYEQALVKPEHALKIGLESRYKTLANNVAGRKQPVTTKERAYSVMAGSNSAVAVERYHRIASLYGVEPRHPFMDRRLVEFCAWLPMELRLRNGYPKWALREAMSRHLPHEIAWRCGKEHLGWLFNKALWGQVGAGLMAGNLHPWLKSAVLESVQTRRNELITLPTAQPVNENEVEPLLSLTALNFWLRKDDKTS
jgi:asparagine synthase (glutamine-hydrolysing)